MCDVCGVFNGGIICMCGMFYGRDVVKYGECVCPHARVCIKFVVYSVWYVYAVTEVVTVRNQVRASVNQNILKSQALESQAPSDGSIATLWRLLKALCLKASTL